MIEPDSPVNETSPGDTPGPDLRPRLMRERLALLDLSTRNRLLNVPMRTRNVRTIEIVDEKSVEIFRLLNDGKAMTFLPGVDTGDGETGGIPQPEDDPFEAIGQAARRHIDLKLQTKLTSEALQKRLFDIWYDARTLEQEQGVNILYLALGLLRWYDDEKSENPRHAPLVLLPVTLERGSAAEKFRLKGRGEPPSPNLTLQAKMRADFNLVIPNFPDEDDVDLAAYAERVRDAVAGHKRWEVQTDACVLGFFSFAKFLMYRDLDPETWPQTDGIDDHPLIRALLHDGFAPDEPLIAEGQAIDAVLPPAERMHVVDADSSQTVAIAEAAGGRTLVIKGPPGTGKSQTITNIIAAAVARGKKVLFVAEKMAALDVVHRRLQQAGLGPLTLELHSNKVNKRTVLEELKRTKDAVIRHPPQDLSVIDKLDETTRDLNAFAVRLHTPLSPSGLSPQQILTRLARSLNGDALPLSGAENWTMAEAEQRRELAADIAGRLAQIGPVIHHPWRGVQADALDPSQRDQLARDIATARDHLHQALGQAATAIRLFGAPETGHVRDLDAALAYLQLTPLPRDADVAAFTLDAWRNTKALGDLIAAGQHLNRLRHEARGLFNDAGLGADYSAIRADVAAKSGDLFRFLDGAYKRHIAILRSYLKGPLPKGVSARLKLIDLAIALQTAQAGFARMEALGVAFGTVWQGADSDWEALDNVLRWRQSHHALPVSVWPKLAALSDADLRDADSARQALYAALSGHRAAMDTIVRSLDLDLAQAFGGQEPKVAELDARLSAWLGDMEGLGRYIAFAARGRRLAEMGAASLTDAIHDGRLDHGTLLPAYDAAYAKVLRDVLFAQWPELKGFDGEAQDRDVARFQALDSGRIDLAKAQIAALHSLGRPKAAGGIGPLGVLNAELAKKRAHLPIRQLLDQAGPAIQALKPVFMMSPLSVAQFLKPGGLEFDLLVMDEASQIEPVDALGSVARVKQLVVVGDERQLPPTAFFKKLTGEDDIADGADEADAALLSARDTESILDLCLAKGAPHRMLNWHYRSRHQSLIAVSNREFYDSQLFIVPSPFDAVSGMGLKFHRLDNAPYDRGGTRTNPVEARIVAEAVIAHARTHPEQSLGVAAFSVSQRQAILEQLERLRRAHPDTEDFFSEAATEPFFVKNLENIQGDERDVIFISVGYGRTAEGTLAHGFGPLSLTGGERRLNVLISRAKMRCEVFCNFSGADIDLERTQARGVAALKLFLTFAETGRFEAAPQEAQASDADMEQDIAAALRAAGHEVRTRIGVSGFRVDVAVVDPDRPGRFLLGIECDGAQYRDARTARDRDRLRRQVLEAHGWSIHRVWSADWYLRPKEELRRIEEALRAARSRRDEHGLDAPPAPAPAVVAGLATGVPLGDARVLYREADFHVPAADPDRLSISDLADYAARIVAIEGPVHSDEVAARLRTLFGLGRVTPRLKNVVTVALRAAEGRGEVTAADGFYFARDTKIAVRDRSQVLSSGLKKPDMLPPQEIDHTIVTVVSENFGAPRPDLIQSVARRLGFPATGSVLRDRIDGRVENLLQRNILSLRDGLIVSAEAR